MARQTDESDEAQDAIARAVPLGVRIAGAYAWPLVGVLILVAVAIYLVVLLHIVVIPILVATLISGLISPVKNRLIGWHWPRGLAVAATFVGLLVVVAALVTLVVLTFRSGYADLQAKAMKAYTSFLAYLGTAPFGLSDTDVKSAVTSATKWLESNSGTILSGALTGASTVGDIAVGLLLSLFITLFFLIDGAGIWRWLVRLAPRRARPAVDGGGRAAWISVGQYVRVQVVVAFIDAVGIGLVAFFLGLPLVVPIAVVVFLAAFIPFVGAVVTGGLAVLVALVTGGPVTALIMLAGVIGVNQLESHVLQPLLMGTAVRLHPIAVVLAVSSGSIIAGIGGAVFAVPLAAAVNSAVQYIAGGAWRGEPQPPASPCPASRSRAAELHAGAAVAPPNPRM